jgi:transcriptional antiterminator NusG
MHSQEQIACDQNGSFYAVKVRVCGELSVAENLRRKGYSVLSPSYVEQRQYSDRIRKADRALFPGYVFVSLDARQLLPLLSTDGVSYVVKSGNTLRPLPDDEVNLLTTLCHLSQQCEPCQPLKVGQRILIEAGPLAGIRGVLSRVGENDRIILSVASIFQSVSVDLRNTAVRLLGSE